MTTPTYTTTAEGLPSLPPPPPWLLPLALIIFVIAVCAAATVYHLTFHRGLDVEPEFNLDSSQCAASSANSTTSAYSDNISSHDRSPNGQGLGLGWGLESERARLVGAAGSTNTTRDGSEERGRGHCRAESRIQKIWEERMRMRAKKAGHLDNNVWNSAATDADDHDGVQDNMTTLMLPRTPDHWAIDEGGGSAVEMEGWRSPAVQTNGGGLTARRRTSGYVSVPGDHGDFPPIMRGEGGGRGGGTSLLEGVTRKWDAWVEQLAEYFNDDGAGEEGLVFPVTEERGDVRGGWELEMRLDSWPKYQILREKECGS